jgi:tetratricopeptide (TPR) repeat protein
LANTEHRQSRSGATFLLFVVFLPSRPVPTGARTRRRTQRWRRQALGRKDIRAAREAIAAAIDDRDDVVEYHLMRGRIERAAGSDAAAFNAYNDALALDATNGEALLNVAQLGLSTGHLRDSLDATEHVLTLAPDNIDALLLRGIHSIIKRKYSEAIEYGDKILAISPGHEGGTILKSRALFMARKPDEALKTLEGISGASVDSEAAALTRLEIYRALRQSERLGPEFNHLRKLRPDDLGLRTDDANFRFKTGERSLAHELVVSVLASPQVNREDAELALALWDEYGSQDVPQASLGRINRSGSAAARQALARFLIRHDRAAQANTTLSTLAGPAGAGLRARYLMLTGKSSEALDLAMGVLGRDTTDCDALIAASEGTLKERKADDALRFAQQASAECPDQPGGWLASARAYQALGRKSGVDRVYGQALEANKQSSELYRGLHPVAGVRRANERGDRHVSAPDEIRAGSRQRLAAVRQALPNIRRELPRRSGPGPQRCPHDVRSRSRAWRGPAQRPVRQARRAMNPQSLAGRIHVVPRIAV